MGMIEHVNIRVRGMVQGVYYRASAREKAVQLGVKGFVRNEKDGSVYLEAEGSSDRLQELVSWCRQGPPSAHVREIESAPGEVQGFSDFSIRR